MTNLKINQWDQVITIQQRDIENLYLDYVNNFMTLQGFADYYGLTLKSAEDIYKHCHVPNTAKGKEINNVFNFN